jgi:hypothetical protein
MPEAKEKRLREEWNATDILKRLDKLHKDFYPTPIKIELEELGRKHISPKETDALTKAEIPVLYGRCSEFIHRGSMATLLTQSHPRWPTDTAEIVKWGQKISNLLSEHWIGHVGGATHLLCQLADPIQGVNVVFAAQMADEIEEPAQSPARQGPIILPGLHPSKPWKPQS